MVSLLPSAIRDLIICLAGINHAVVKEAQLDMAFKAYTIEHGISWGAQLCDLLACI
jgi:hypothetical protein